MMSDFPRLRLVLRSGRSTSRTRNPSVVRYLATPAPHAPVPSTPTATTIPKPQAQVTKRRWPFTVVGNDWVPSSFPRSSSTAATWTSPWVSTPTVTRASSSAMVSIAIPSLDRWTGWHAPAG